MPPSHEPTPWRMMLASAMRIGVPPHAFWRLSLLEWRALTSPIEHVLTRTALHALAQQYPDETR